MRKTLFAAWLGVLLLWSCQPAQQKTVPEQGTDTTDERTMQVPDDFKVFIDISCAKDEEDANGNGSINETETRKNRLRRRVVSYYLT